MDLKEFEINEMRRKKCLFYQAVFPEVLKFTVYMLREIVITECVSRVVICKSESVEMLSVGIVEMETAK
jgi:hypothetical protein